VGQKLLILGTILILVVLGITSCTCIPGTTPPGQETEEYGTPGGPETEPEIEVPEDYPYLAILPPGAEGKIQFAYNYAIDPSGKAVEYKYKLTNLSDRPLAEWQYNVILKDSKGSVLTGGEAGSIPKDPLQPGKSEYLGGGLGGSQPFGSSSIESWTLEIEVIYVRFK